MLFDTQYRKHKRFNVCSGSPVAPVFSSKFDNDGRLVVYKSGETNLNAFIQSFKDSVNLDLIIERYQNGDSTALEKRKGFFYDGEFSFPGNLLDCLNLVNKGRQEFDSLSAEIRAKFDNDFGKFLAEYGSDNFRAILGLNSPESDVGGDLGDPPLSQPAPQAD